MSNQPGAKRRRGATGAAPAANQTPAAAPPPPVPMPGAEAETPAPPAAPPLPDVLQPDAQAPMAPPAAPPAMGAAPDSTETPPLAGVTNNPPVAPTEAPAPPPAAPIQDADNSADYPEGETEVPEEAVQPKEEPSTAPAVPTQQEEEESASSPEESGEVETVEKTYTRDKAPLKGEMNSAEKLEAKGWSCIPHAHDNLTADEIGDVLNELSHLRFVYEEKLIHLAKTGTAGVPQEEYDDVCAKLAKAKKIINDSL